MSEKTKVRIAVVGVGVMGSSHVRDLARLENTELAAVCDIDRDKAQALGVPVTDIFTTLQATLGGIYVNDFNLFGRTWQVKVMADQGFRSGVDDLRELKVATGGGGMVPLATVLKFAVEPGQLVRLVREVAAVLVRTVKVAQLVTLPHAPVTWTQYVAASPAITPGKDNALVVAPPIGAPFFAH